MTRTAIGGIAAGAFTLGILAGLVLPGSLAPFRHDQPMAGHMSAAGSMPMGSMPMGVGSMPMGVGSMPMGSMPMMAGHDMHHASPQVGR